MTNEDAQLLQVELAALRDAAETANEALCCGRKIGAVAGVIRKRIDKNFFSLMAKSSPTEAARLNARRVALGDAIAAESKLLREALK